MNLIKVLFVLSTFSFLLFSFLFGLLGWGAVHIIFGNILYIILYFIFIRFHTVGGKGVRIIGTFSIIRGRGVHPCVQALCLRSSFISSLHYGGWLG